MPRTVTDYLNLMRHGLGKTPDARHSLINDFNDAGRALFTAAEGNPWYHSWSWLVRDKVPFTVPGGLVEEVELPEDFGSLVALEFDNTFIGHVETITAAGLAQMRRHPGSIDALRLYICFDVGKKQATKTSVPKTVAAFWPPRDAAQTGISLTYRRAWVDMTTNDGSAIPDIPPDYERLLMLMSRAYAIHLEDQTAAFEDEQVKAEINALAISDSGRQPNKGRAHWSVRAAAGTRNLENWYGRRIIRP